MTPRKAGDGDDEGGDDGVGRGATGEEARLRAQVQVRLNRLRLEQQLAARRKARGLSQAHRQRDRASPRSASRALPTLPQAFERLVSRYPTRTFASLFAIHILSSV